MPDQASSVPASPVFERRAYTFRPETRATFWELQVKWNLGLSFEELLAHNLSYFETVGGSEERVVHLYRFDSLQQWDEIYARIYANHPKEHFAAARALITHQENEFLRPAPVAGLGLGEEGLIRPDLTMADPEAAIVVETTTRCKPGGLATYWAAWDRYVGEAPEAARRGLIGVYFVLVGRLHAVRDYRWFDSEAEARRFAEHDADAAARAYTDAYRDLVAEREIAYLRPAPTPNHRKLFLV